MFDIERFDPATASREQLEAFNDCSNILKKEKLPDDPPTSLEQLIKRFKSTPDFVETFFWIVWDKERTRAVANTVFVIAHQDNLHLGQFEINVIPSHRQKGIAKAILPELVKVAEQKERSLLITVTGSNIPAGEVFMNRLGANKGLESRTSQLTLANLDSNQLEKFSRLSKQKAQGFESGFWDGPYPEEDMDEIAELYDLVNQQPLGDLEVEDFHFSVDQIRQIEKSVFGRGFNRWTYYAREKQSGKFAGFTEIVWNPEQPEIINQGFTGVFPQFRGNGIGRLLKIEMLEKVLAELPEAKFIRTGNADSNAPMLKINTDLGFKLYNLDSVWQISIEQVKAYLSAD